MTDTIASLTLLIFLKSSEVVGDRLLNCRENIMAVYSGILLAARGVSEFREDTLPRRIDSMQDIL